MMRRARHLLVGATAAIVASTVGVATPATADDGHRVLATTLNGDEEFPGPGDDNGKGLAGLLINTESGRICYVLAVRRIEPATMAHIHVGAAETAGPIVVNLDPPTRGFSANCADADPALAADIANRPEQYYVNVHNTPFPAGAIRGQLG